MPALAAVRQVEPRPQRRRQHGLAAIGGETFARGHDGHLGHRRRTPARRNGVGHPFAYAFSMDAVLSCLIVGCGYVGSRLARRESARRPLLALVRSGKSETDLQSAGVLTLRIDLDAAADASAATGAGRRRRPGGCRLPGSAARHRHHGPAARIAAGADRRCHARCVRLHQHDRRLWRRGRRARRRVHARRAGERPLAPAGCSRKHGTGLVRGTRRALRDPARAGNLRAEPPAAGTAAAARARLARRGCRPGQSHPCRRPGRGHRGRRRSPVGAGRVQRDRWRLRQHHRVPAADGRGRGDRTSRAHQQGRGARRRFRAGMLSFLLESRRVDNRRMLEELGLQLQYPTLQSGVLASLAEMRQAPEAPAP